MSRSPAVLRVRGLRTPRLFIWCRGFLHGRLLHSAGVDPRTGTLASSYVTGQVHRFHKACADRRENAERRLAKDWSDADRLLLDLSDAEKELAAAVIPPKQPDETSSQIRAREKAAALRAAIEARRLALLKDLADIYNRVLREFNEAADQMDATAARLLSCFAAYGHGATLQPVFDGMLPEVGCGDCAEGILTDHHQTWNELTSALKEVRQ